MASFISEAISRAAPLLASAINLIWTDRQYNHDDLWCLFAGTEKSRMLLGFGAASENRAQGAKQLANGIRAAGIIDHLPVAARLDQTEGSQLCQMLRKSRLAEIHLFGDRAYCQFVIDEMIHDGEPLLVSHQCEERSCGFGIGDLVFWKHQMPTFVHHGSHGGNGVMIHSYTNFIKCCKCGCNLKSQLRDHASAVRSGIDRLLRRRSAAGLRHLHQRLAQILLCFQRLGKEHTFDPVTVDQIHSIRVEPGQ